MSPNLSPSHFLPNKLLYEQVIINALSLVGIASYLHRVSPEDRLKDKGSREIFVSDRDLQVLSGDCVGSNSKCFDKDGCRKEPKCELCRHRMNCQLRDILRSTHGEHISRSNMRRILPHTVYKP